MSDVLTKAQRRKNMQHIKAKDTVIEVLLRKALWKKGIRYRKNYAAVPGKPDIALTKYKIAIFCDGEFFHGKDWDKLREKLLKSDNGSFWIEKIEHNMKRDDEVNKALLFLGWTVLRFWGIDIKKHTDECIRAVEESIAEIVLEGTSSYEDNTKINILSESCGDEIALNIGNLILLEGPLNEAAETLPHLKK